MRHIVVNPITQTVVSIHASVKDATKERISLYLENKGFNPRICKRCDFKKIWQINQRKVSIHASVKDATGYQRPWYEYVQFQSTHL